MVEEISMDGAQEYVKTAPIHATQQPTAFVVTSLEGKVRGEAGDYLATGIDGETWPINQESFPETYEPIPDQPDMYRKKGTVRAKQMPDSFHVECQGNVLQGNPGDYVVEDNEGHEWVCDQSVFERTYTPIVDVPGKVSKEAQSFPAPPCSDWR